MSRISYATNCEPYPMPRGFSGVSFLKPDGLVYVGRSNLLAIKEAWRAELAIFENCSSAYSHFKSVYGADMKSPVGEYSKIRLQRAKNGIRLIDGLLESAVDKPLFCFARGVDHFKYGDEVFVWIDPCENRGKIFQNIKHCGYYEAAFLGREVGSDVVAVVSVPALWGDCKNFKVNYKSPRILRKDEMHYLCYDPVYCDYYIHFYDCKKEDDVLYDISFKTELFKEPPVGLNPDKLPDRPVTLIL